MLVYDNAFTLTLPYKQYQKVQKLTHKNATSFPSCVSHNVCIAIHIAIVLHKLVAILHGGDHNNGPLVVVSVGMIQEVNYYWPIYGDIKYRD